MAPTRRFLGLFCILALVGLACGLSVDLGPQTAVNPTTAGSIQDAISTGVAQTLQSITQQVPSPTLTVTPTATETATPPSQPATLSVSVATNCYAGPGSSYAYVITLSPGVIAALEGQDPADNYWIIEVPGAPGSVCWLWGQYASVSGNTAFLYLPPTPVLVTYTLDEPRNLRASCMAEYSSGGDGGWWDGGPPWSHPTPTPTKTPWVSPTPWAHKTPRPEKTPWPTRTPSGDGWPWDGGSHGGGDWQHGHGSDLANGTPLPSPTPEVYATPAAIGPESQGEQPLADGAPQWASYSGRNHINSWTVELKWKNIDPYQTAVQIYKNGRRIDTLGKNASSYTDTISGDWNDDITYGVQAYSSWAVSGIVSIDVGRCK